MSPLGGRTGTERSGSPNNRWEPSMTLLTPASISSPARIRDTTELPFSEAELAAAALFAVQSARRAPDYRELFPHLVTKVRVNGLCGERTRTSTSFDTGT